MSWANKRRRTVQKLVTFTPDEWERVNSLHKKVNKYTTRYRSFTVFARKMLTDGEIRVTEIRPLTDPEPLAREIGRIGRNVNQIAHNVNREMNAIILHGIPQSCRAKSLPINEIDMGVASDVNVYTFTRFAPRIGLLGRPRPHGRLRLQTARAACATTVFHLCDRGVTLVSTLFWRCCFGDLRAAARA